ncbi:MAG TPA: EAL domain-containing protein, partial [Methylococcaceae bacterium]|nr:EAL domain-containing protein [Methylococcaceae bacterium]
AGIVHGGVKPHNILVQSGTLSLRLTDFITPLDIRDVSHFIYDASFVRDTLAYTSPEQTGRINHRVDFSTDLYSLGIVLYELLAGRPPFFSGDPLELIHLHLAGEAPELHAVNPAVPRQLGAIVARLILKEPEKRYQSGNGLLADLIRCRDEYAATDDVAPFPTGRHDRTRRVVFISKMVGRAQEARTILGEYDQVTRGAFRSLLISGLSGIGKTRLIQELQKPLVKHRGYFTSGKFDQYQKNIPYSSLLQALRNLMRTFLTESDVRLAEWRGKIVNAVGGNGRVLSDVVPELEFIIGPQPEVPELPPVEARYRFNHLFGRFLASLASEENPLILFIDDLQWCDVATFDFLQYVFANCGDYPHLYLLGAYRHNEVDASHPLSRLRRAIKDKHAGKDEETPLREIRIGALDPQHCHEMVAYILDASLDETGSLAHFVAELTEGNPLFVSESLAYLYNENLLFRDEKHQWRWDIAKIRDSHMPATVVELFSAKVGKLPEDTLDVLQHCACMGNRFTAQDVALVLDLDLPELFEILKPVLSLGLLLENKTDLQFVHDRVQEAVLRAIPAPMRQSIHWRIGNRLFDEIPAGEDHEKRDNLFTIAAHLNRGRPETPDAATTWQLARINHQAGNKALAALATDAANEFFRTAHALLPADCWRQDYATTYRIFQKLAKTELMCGRYEASETLLNQLIEHAESDLDKAEALAEQTTSLSSIGNFIKAIETANRGLAYFGKSIPQDGVEAEQRMETLMDGIAAQGDVWHAILHMPFTRERRSKIELAFYSELIPDLYMSGLVPQLYLSAAQSTQHCLAGGMDESVIYSFSIMGLNLGEQEKFDPAFRYQDLAHDLCAKHPDTFGATRGINGIVWCNMHSRSHPAEIVDYCLKGIQSGRNCGDLYNAGLCYGPLMWNLAVQGKSLALVEEYARECLNFSRKNGLAFSVGLAEAVLAGWVAPMKADYTPVAMDDKLAQWAGDNHVASAGSHFVLLGVAHYYLGEYEQADACLQRVNQYLTGLTDNVLKRQWYVFRILNTLRLEERRHGLPLAAAALHELEPLLHKVKTWSGLGPLLQPYLAFVKAEWARAHNEKRKARNLYQDAVEAAGERSYILLEGHIYQCLGELRMETQPGISSFDFGAARRLYQLCGAERKERLLLERHTKSFREAAVREAELVCEIPVPATLPDLDLSYLMKSALAISAEIELEQLLHKIMKVVLECSGAQHGYLLVKDGGEPAVLAESHVAGQRNGTHGSSAKNPADAGPTVKTERRTLTRVAGVCHAIVNYVFHTQEKVLLRNAGAEGPFTAAPQVRELRLRSVLCLPILKQGQLTGVLYLENRLADGVFTPEKSGMTELLTAQAAISLENARLLQDTRQAEEALRALNETLEQRVADALARNREKDLLLIDELERTAQHESMRGYILELLAKGAPLAEILQGVIRDVEQRNPSLLCRIELPDDEGTHPPAGSAPSLPAVYAEPIQGASGEVIGTFSISRHEAGTPSEDDLRLIVQAANLAGIAIERSRTDAELRLASMVYQTSSEAMTIADADGSIIAVNPAFTQLTGYTREEVIGRNPRILKSGRHDEAFYQAMWHSLTTTGQWQGEIWNRRKNGEIYPEWLTINTIYHDDGSPHRRIALFSDITQKKITEELIWQQANFDPLTGLPNRRMFHDRLEQEIKKAHRTTLPLALLFLDLDRFKEINDTLGHDMGDLLLKTAAQRLQGCVRETDAVARLGGDEFTVILNELEDTGSVERVAQEILRQLAEPFSLGSESAYVSASIGITLYPADAASGDVLIKNADQAMYAAKDQGRNRYHYFTPSMQEIAQARMRLANDLHGALAGRQFWLAYQPIVELATGVIHKAEALLRWQHPARGPISPTEFIPLAEDTGLIVEIGDWVFREAACQAAHWRASHHGEFQIGINKSPVQFRSEHDNHAAWFDYLRQLGLPGQSMVVEITEGLLLDAGSAVTDQLLAFRDAGIQVSLDDFGTGYSALSYLKKFDIDYIKIDQSFVRNLAPASSDLALCEAIIVMAHKLGIQVIAEGVETQEQCNLLLAAGCDYGQGYLFSRPVTAEEFDAFLLRTSALPD